MSPLVHAKADASYHVVWHKSLEKLDVEVCPGARTSLTLQNHQRDLSTALMEARQANVSIKTRRNRLNFNPKLSACLSYSVSLKQRGRYPYQIESHNLVMPTHLWFWGNEQIKTASFSFADNKGSALQFYLPWPKINNQWQLNATPKTWTSRTVVGNVEKHQIHLSHGQSVNAVLVGSLNQSPQRWRDWLKTNAQAIETGFSHFPINQANILVVPTQSRKSPVPWGEVQRGGHPSVHFFIDANKSRQTFEQDWTASHEMSHLFVPKTHWRDRWLSEGIASYYQNVLRARAGILTQQQAWQKMRDGFARGRRDFNQRNLRNVNKVMHLYWGGVGIYLLADLRLRENGTSLDEVLKKFNQCCFTLDETWTAEALFSQFDELSGSSVFMDLLRREAQAVAFPISTEFEQADNPLLQRHLNKIFTVSSTKASS